MRILSFLIILLLVYQVDLVSQSKHGESIKVDCSNCHESSTWAIKKSDMTFSHNRDTDFKLTGQHLNINCRSCHPTLIFTDASPDCFSCHKDIHQNTVGFDCAKCHTPESWIVKDIDGLHQVSRFPLLGAHKTADCSQCHTGFENFTFGPLGTSCYDCHEQNYLSTTSPNHIQAGFSTECQDCHSINELNWAAENFNHNFFPLTGGHKISNCFTCHEQGSYTGLSPECYSCHQQDYEGVTDPNHVAGNFPKDCKLCHNINAWVPSSFDHNLTQFPLTGAHLSINCSSCHSTGYTNTPKECVACHQTNYNASVNPNHTTLALPTDCASCHTTNPGWEPASFPNHNTYYELLGAHASIASNCASCHNGNYNNTPNTCVGCHQQDYNATTNPPHASAGFSTECQTCHNQNAWSPSTFNHDNQYFPIYSGKHAGVWTQCSECHTTPSNFTVFSCTDCHEHNRTDTDEEHQGIAGYIYSSEACYACHPDGTSAGAFNHNNSIFPLTGAHTTVNCQQCHQSGYAGTPTECVACHQINYNASANPSHTALALPTDCASCHTTNPGWEPASFPNHNNYYELIGAHAAVAANCISCHNGNYNTTPNTCFGCHEQNYNATTNPPHASAGFGTDCQTCHTQTAWTPATFDHDIQYFPIYTGRHAGVWTLCSECHTTPQNFTVFSCIDCHEHNQLDTDEHHTGVSGYVYASDACYACHPQGTSAGAFNHNTSIFPLTGAHITISCQQCHQSGYAGTPTECVACHQTNYNNTANPSHTTLAISTDCASCHTTNPGWEPALFPQHAQYFELTGAHLQIANNCVSCHNGNYNNTPNECVGCHQNAYNGSTNPNHTALAIPTTCQTCHTTNPGWAPATFPIHNNYYALIGAHALIANQCNTCHNGNYNNTPGTCDGCHHDDYLATTNPNHQAASFPLECQTCHTQNAWQPSTFDHDNQYFPIYSGQHNGQWNSCYDCHSDPTNFGNFTCTTACHPQAQMNSEHLGVSGYVYQSSACYACHPDGSSAGAFNHNTSIFPLTGAHLTLNCQQCHQSGYPGTPTECVACHQTNYNNAANPSHTALAISTNCVSCHTTNPGWEPALFPQHAQYFELTGAHLQIANNCISCHNGNYNNTPNQCVGCHQTAYNNAQNPNHAAAAIPTTCQNCHTSSAWIPSTFNHTSTGFELLGQHAAIQCSACHQGIITGLSPECYPCHQQNYNNAPNHVTQNYPHTCQLCHNSVAWNQVSFNHNNTNFPLTGAHITTSCISCHQTGYTGTTTVCSDCHQNAYNGSTNPNHTALAIPTTCQTCHTTNPGWTPATFPIHNNYYALIGAHALIANQCNTCHNGNYNNTPNTCDGCHHDDYLAATDPNHQAASFPLECQTCHTQNAWVPSTFNHDGLYFPIYSGNHQGRWNSCYDCHPDPANFGNFTCTTACHPQAQMNSEHQGISGYVYQSSACLNCHPDGGGEMKIKSLKRD